MAPREIKYKSITIDQKLKAIRDVESGMKKTDVAKKYGIKLNSLSNILKIKEQLKSDFAKEPLIGKKKRLRHGKFQEVEQATKQFVSQAREANVPVNGEMIKQTAEFYASSLGKEEFKASNGWLEGFKHRNGFTRKCLTDAPPEVEVADAIMLQNTTEEADKCLEQNFSKEHMTKGR